jgi:hypothetical protein
MNPLLAMGFSFMEDLKEIEISIEERIQQAKDKYWEACKYPRKIKKRLRKQALKEYSIHCSIKQWNEETFGKWT